MSEPNARRGPWQGRAGLGAIGAGLGCFLLISLLGPSVMQPALPGEPGQPPYSLVVNPSPYLAVGVVVLGILASAAGTGLCLYAVGRGWRCRPLPLVVSGLLVAVAMAGMPPVGSGDHLNYAAYGRMVVTGHDPYATSAADLPSDPVAGVVQEWRDTPSVYGPLATAQEAVASRVGGDSTRLTVFVMSLFNLLAFGLTALVLYRTAGSRERRLRSALMWTFNPLLLFHLVAGAHNDVLAIAPMVAALAVFTGRTHRNAAVTGALVGAGILIKLPAGMVGGGPAWVLLRRWWTGRRDTRSWWTGRRDTGRWWTGRGETGRWWAGRGTSRGVPWRALVLFGTSGAVVAGAFALAGPHALDQLARASNSVSLATPWHLFDMMLGPGGHRTLIKIGWISLMAVLVALLVRALPDEGEARDDVRDARRIAAALVLAWLFAAPYELPWYDGFAWAALALLAWSRFDGLLLAHTAALSLAYLPARDPELIGMPDGLGWLVSVLRSGIIPVVTTGILIALVVTCRRHRPPAPAPERRPRASAASRG